MRLLLLSVLLSLAACLPPAARFPGAVRPTVKIGLVAPFEGRYRAVGYEVIYAARLALREVGASGGVGGYGVELVAYDDGADPAMAVEQARKLSVDPEVMAVIGHFREETTAAALDVYAGEGLSLVAPNVLGPGPARAFSSRSHDGPPICRLGPSAATVAGGLLDHFGGLGLRKVALVTAGGAMGEALARDVRPGEPQVRPVVSPEHADWLGSVLASGAEVVLCDAAPVTAGEVLLALRQAGWNGEFVAGPDVAQSDFFAVAGEAAEGTLLATPWPWPGGLAGGEEFVASYGEVSGGLSAGPLALQAYESTWVLLEALGRDVAAHGKPSRGGLAAALWATAREGLLGPITFDGECNWSQSPLYWYRVGAGGVPRRVTE